MIDHLDIGLKPYLEVLELQRNLHSKRVAGEISDTLIFCEHPPVFTIGRQDSSADWISDFKTIAGDEIDVVQTDRGGRITYHGPGQLIVYFIFNIERFGVKGFVRAVEDACIKALEKFGVHAERSEEHPGLWVNDNKIVALGFHISRNVSMHGLALNVAPDLRHYRHIIPCGIKDKGITSMKALGGVPSMEKLKSVLIDQFRTFSTDEKVREESSSTYALI